MLDESLIKVAKVFGWNWLGHRLGIPIRDFAQAIHQEQNQIIQENQNLKQRLSELVSSYLQIWSENWGLRKQLSQKEEVISQLQREIEERKTQKAPQLQTFPEIGKETSSNLITLRWLEVMPKFIRCVILGAPDSGKSATAHMLLELHRWKMTPYVLGFPEEKKGLLPEWVGLATSFEKIPPDSIVLVDEAYLLYHARKGGFDRSVQEMSRALGLARQRGHSILFVAHEARHLDKNIIGYANLFVVKEPGPMEVKFERPELKEVLRRARDCFQEMTADRRRWSYVWSPEADFEGPLETPLPSYWTEELSRAYAQGISTPAVKAPSVSKEEKKAQARSLREGGVSYGKIAKVLGVSKATIISWLKHGR